MIKIERNLEYPEIEKAKSVLEFEQSKVSGKYNCNEVVEALKLVFHSKCYLCENKSITSYNVEHLRPHKNKNMNLKFDWNNLFLACAHCNNIKLGTYENILDCTKINVDELITFRKRGNFSWEEKIEIIALENNISINETVDLLNKIYNGTTEMKILESYNIKKELRKELNKFINMMDEYYEAKGADKEDAKSFIKQSLKSNSPFSAFKRWLIRDNKDKFLELFLDDMLYIN